MGYYMFSVFSIVSLAFSPASSIISSASVVQPRGVEVAGGAHGQIRPQVQAAPGAVVDRLRRRPAHAAVPFTNER